MFEYIPFLMKCIQKYGRKEYQTKISTLVYKIAMKIQNINQLNMFLSLEGIEEYELIDENKYFNQEGYDVDDDAGDNNDEDGKEEKEEDEKENDENKDNENYEEEEEENENYDNDESLEEREGYNTRNKYISNKKGFLGYLDFILNNDLKFQLKTDALLIIIHFQTIDPNLMTNENLNKIMNRMKKKRI